MSKLIAVIDAGYKDYSFETSYLKRFGYNFEIFMGDSSDTKAKIKFSQNAVGLFVRGTKIDASFLKQLPKLKVIVRYGTGYDNIDLDAASLSGVKVANVSGYGNHSVSDHALSLIYACARGLFVGQAAFKNIFGQAPFTRIFEMHRKTLGIIGLGRIGGTLARKTVALFNRVLACDPYIADSRFTDLGVRKTKLSVLLNQSDVICLHCNLTHETNHLLNRNAFEQMKQVPIIVNTARGPVIEAEALLDALNAGKIHSCGLDVYDSETAEEIPEELLSHPKIITTGHYAWFSENSVGELQKQAGINMIALLSGQEIEDCLN